MVLTLSIQESSRFVPLSPFGMVLTLSIQESSQYYNIPRLSLFPPPLAPPPPPKKKNATLIIY